MALAPLDNRPCNYRFPRQLAAIAGDELLLPEERELGSLHQPGNSEAVVHWIDRLPAVDALLVSVDMVAYGGLVSSRRPVVTVAQALKRLQVLKQFRMRYPRTPILAFNVLMRLAVTLDSDAALDNYYNVMRYARLADEAERFDSDYLRGELSKVEAAIPPAVLQDYLDARRRNHQINQSMLEWLADGTLDYLLLTQEDASEYGLHRREQQDLLRRAGELAVRGRFSLHPGADEAALTLLARHWNTGLRLNVHWSHAEGADAIAAFEDRPYRQAFHEHVAAVHGIIVQERDCGTSPAPPPADWEIFINAPRGSQQKDESTEERAQHQAALQPLVGDLSSAMASNLRCALCDVAFPNGADNVLLAELEQRGLLGGLQAFAAWNTAGNTTGTVLAQMAAVQRGGQRDLNREFVLERLVDDWCYQSRVRSRMERVARELDLSPFDMGEGYTRVEAQVRRELRGMARLLAQRHFQTAVNDCRVTLPWQRAFEADVRIDLGTPEVPATV